MKVWTGMSAGARMSVVAVTAAVLAAVGYFGFGRAPEDVVPEISQPEVALDAVAPEVAPDVAPEVAPVVTGEQAAVDTVVAAETATPTPIEPAVEEAGAAAEPLPPGLDLVRVAPDGGATVAGTAAPGAVVALLVDGAEVIRVTADASGNFVALFDLIASDLPRLLTVVATGPDGVEVAGSEVVALAPIAPPVVVAEAQADAVAGEAVPDVTSSETTTAVAEGAAVDLPAPAAILVSPEGVKVLQTAQQVPADVAANVYVNTIAYSADGAVQLGGIGHAGGALRIYLDGVAVADTFVGTDGTWSLVLTDVAPGLYTLRVDQLAADGSVSSRFETPFKRETLEALAAAAEPVKAAPLETPPMPSVAANSDAGADSPTLQTSEPTVAVDATAPAMAPAAASVGATSTDAPNVATTDPAPAALALADAAPDAPVQPEQPTPAGLVSVTVQPGFTLWGIAKKEFGSGVLYVQVFDANRDKIKNPDLIYPGQIFLLPGKN